MKIRPHTWVTADTHFCHGKIQELRSRPEKADEIIVREWNSRVRKKDTIVVLGDLSMGNKEVTRKITERLNGNKFLISGNHDGHSQTWYRDCGFDMEESVYKRFKDKYERYITVLFTHIPVYDLPQGWFNIHGHLHGDDHRGIQPNTKQYYDVGVDVRDYKPIILYEILEEFRSRK